jgi:fatty acid synthase
MAMQLTIERPGDIETLSWKARRPTDTRVAYAALNFKDVMYAFGKLRLKKPSFGLEFSGTQRGRPVMGITTTGSIATHVDPVITWEVPTTMSLVQAATIPVVYCTALYALFDRARLTRGQSVLIHAGSGGVGHAAIHLCQQRGIEVFTTCSAGKRSYVQESFGLSDTHVFDSRSTVFREQVLGATGGRGVDCVLNCLSGEMLDASLAVVADFGSFCEIGKFDLMNNTKIGLKVFERNISYHAMDLADMFSDPPRAQRLQELLRGALADGIVSPLPHHVFEAEQHETALRYMAAGKHLGKVLIQLPQSDQEPQTTVLPPTRMGVVVVPRFTTSGTHIITGGLGGFGLELARWLVACGATKLVLTSRSGVTGARQTSKLHKLQRDIDVVISTRDVCEETECSELLQEQGSGLRGVWHLATVLDDVGFTNMTEAKWASLHRIKVDATTYLDQYTRRTAVDLDAFVVFSSISSMVGNAGQSNYASANNAAEMLVHARNTAGHRGLAIQWGAIDNVGVMMHGTRPREGVTNRLCEFQNIDHSLESLHHLLQYNGVRSSYAEKQLEMSADGDPAMELSVACLQSQFARMLGGSADSYHIDTPFNNFGLDSLSSVELANWVNRFVTLKITAAFFEETATIDSLYTYMTTHLP